MNKRLRVFLIVIVIVFVLDALRQFVGFEHAVIGALAVLLAEIAMTRTAK